MTERFEKLSFPIHKVTAKTPEELFKILPGLQRYFNNVMGIKDMRNLPAERMSMPLPADYLVKIIKYIVFVYDPNTDLLQEYPDDMRLLKEAAAKEAGFSRDEFGEWPEYLKLAMDLKNDQVVGWIIDYLAIQKNATWRALKYLDEEIEVLYERRTIALKERDFKTDYFNMISDREEKRELLVRKFFAEHIDLKKEAQDIMYPVTPENVFKELKVPEEYWKIKQVKDVPAEARPS